MSKWFKFTKYIILSTALFTGFSFLSGYFLSTPVAAIDGITCVQINFEVDGRDVNLNELEFEPDIQGRFTPINVKVNIQILNPSFEGTVTGAYRWGYIREGYDWVVETGFRMYRIGDSPVFGTNLPNVPATELIMRLDAPGNWQYALEYASEGLPGVTGPGGGCPQAETAPEKYTSFTVGVRDANESVWAGTCSELEDRGFSLDSESRFSCTNGAPSGAPWSGQVSPSNDNLCYPDEDFYPDELGCSTGQTYFGQSLSTSVGAYCLPCITSEQRQLATDRAEYLEACDNSNPLSCVQGLNCVATNPADRSVSGVEARCIKPPLSIDTVGESCYFYSTECGIDKTNVNAGEMSCAREGNSGFVGKCAPLAEAGDECSLNSDYECTVKLNDENAVCQSIRGTNFCMIPPQPEAPDSDDIPNDYAYSTEQFGAIRCPFARYSKVANPQSAEDYMDERAARDRRAEGGEVFVVPDANRSPEELREFGQCVECISAGATWTGGFGCIATDIQGLFNSILRIVLGVMGGVALIRLIILGYQYQFEEKADLKPTVQDILATLGGLLLVLFSVVLLRFIGVNLLDIVPAGFFG